MSDYETRAFHGETKEKTLFTLALVSIEAHKSIETDEIVLVADGKTEIKCGRIYPFDRKTCNRLAKYNPSQHDYYFVKLNRVGGDVLYVEGPKDECITVFSALVKSNFGNA